MSLVIRVPKQNAHSCYWKSSTLIATPKHSKWPPTSRPQNLLKTIPQATHTSVSKTNCHLAHPSHSLQFNHYTMIIFEPKSIGRNPLVHLTMGQLYNWPLLGSNNQNDIISPSSSMNGFPCTMGILIKSLWIDHLCPSCRGAKETAEHFLHIPISLPTVLEDLNQSLQKHSVQNNISNPYMISLHLVYVKQGWQASAEFQVSLTHLHV